jgi:hypothetical protein
MSEYWVSKKKVGIPVIVPIILSHGRVSTSTSANIAIFTLPTMLHQGSSTRMVFATRATRIALFASYTRMESARSEI